MLQSQGPHSSIFYDGGGGRGGGNEEAILHPKKNPCLKNQPPKKHPQFFGIPPKIATLVFLYKYIHEMFGVRSHHRPAIYFIRSWIMTAPLYPPLEEDDKLSLEIISIKIIYAKHCSR